MAFLTNNIYKLFGAWQPNKPLKQRARVLAAALCAMRTLLDVGAVLTILIVGYAVCGLFISLPDINPYTYNSFPGSLLVIPLFFLIFYCLRSAFRQRRRYWFVGCLFIWPLSAFYYLLIGRRELNAHDAQQGAQKGSAEDGARFS